MFTANWKQFAPFYFYTIAAVGLAGAAGLLGEFRSAASIAGLIGAGLLSWTVVEYGLHRFAFHHAAPFAAPHRESFSAAHQLHHDQPQAVDQLFTGLGTSIPIAIAYCAAGWILTGSWQAASFLFAGLIAGYFTYEWLHYQAHHGAPRSRPLRYLRKYHLLHHHQTPDLRFGVTSPVIDILCGTFLSTDRRLSRTEARR